MRSLTLRATRTAASPPPLRCCAWVARSKKEARRAARRETPCYGSPPDLRNLLASMKIEYETPGDSERFRPFCPPFPPSLPLLPPLHSPFPSPSRSLHLPLLPPLPLSFPPPLPPLPLDASYGNWVTRLATASAASVCSPEIGVPEYAITTRQSCAGLLGLPVPCECAARVSR